MLARIRKSMDEKDQGFTLIELLVVIIIIGILAAIAIPVFLNQRKKAVDASAKSDLRTIANELETYATDQQAYPATITFAAPTITIAGTAVRVSQGNTPNVYYDAAAATATKYCIKVVNPKGSNAVAGLVYQSDNGGLQAPGSTCAGYGTTIL